MANPFASLIAGGSIVPKSSGSSPNATVTNALSEFILPVSSSVAKLIVAGVNATRSGTAGTITYDSDGFVSSTVAGDQWGFTLGTTLPTNTNYAMVVRGKLNTSLTDTAAIRYPGRLLGASGSHTTAAFNNPADTALVAITAAASGGGGRQMNTSGAAGAINGTWITFIFRATDDGAGNFVHECQFVNASDTRLDTTAQDTNNDWYTSGDPLLTFNLTGNGQIMHHYGALFRAAYASMPSMAQLRAFALAPETYLTSGSVDTIAPTPTSLSLSVGGSDGTITGLTRSAAAIGAKTYTVVSADTAKATVTANTLATANGATTTTGSVTVHPVAVTSPTVAITITESGSGPATSVTVTVAAAPSTFFCRTRVTRPAGATTPAYPSNGAVIRGAVTKGWRGGLAADPAEDFDPTSTSEVTFTVSSSDATGFNADAQLPAGWTLAQVGTCEFSNWDDTAAASTATHGQVAGRFTASL